MKKRKKEFDNSFGISKAAINNYMNNSHHRDEHSQQKDENNDSRTGVSRESKQTKNSNSKYSGFEGDQDKALRDLLQMKNEGTTKGKYEAPDPTKRIDNDTTKGQSKSGKVFKTRKPSADQSKSERNALKDPKITNRSRKSHSSKPTERNSRADSRDVSTRSIKEDSKAGYHNDKPANIQASDPETKDSPSINEDINIVTKFAFATRVGYIPNNPYKVNQDAYILSPNIMKQPAFHYFGVCDGHGQNGKEVSGYVKQRLPVLLESYVKTTGDDKKALTDAFVTVNTELDYVPFDCQFSGTT